MRRAFFCAALLMVALPAHARHAPHPAKPDDTALIGPVFKAGPLQFTIPAKWMAMPPESPARAGQWRVPPPHGQMGDGGEVVAFYFGPGAGGTTKENIEAWMGTMLNAEGNPAAAEAKAHTSAGSRISEVVVFGTYSQVVPIPGIPPISKPDYGLIGTVVENPQGNIYWRFTGPQSLVTATLPLFDKMLDSVKPAGP